MPIDLLSANENDFALYQGKIQGESVMSLQARVIYNDKKSAPVTIKGRLDRLTREWKSNGSAKIVCHSTPLL